MKNKIITIYELLGLIKDDKAPKKIKYYKGTYEFNDNNYYLKGIYEIEYSMFYKLAKGYMFLNNTVEILPEENDELEDIEELKNYPYIVSQDDIINTINQIIKNQRKIIEKLESKDE